MAMVLHSKFVKEFIPGVLFVGIVSLICHFLFSSYGFVPSDDGFMLAYSRRILDGQIPYKDFLSAHNIGTPLLFVPFVKLGGDSTFLITRFVVWLEFATLAWMWATLVIKNFFGENFPLALRILIALEVFFLTAHSFPAMVWYTIDGFLLFSTGLLLCKHENIHIKMIGYFFVGSTFFIKQNFIFLIPATIFLLDDWRSKRYWISLFFPAVLYYGFFLFTGALGDAIVQTSSRTEFFQTAVKGFVGKFTTPWGIILGYSGLPLVRKNVFISKLIGIFVLFIPVIYSVFYLKASGKFDYDASFFLFGTVLGMIISSFVNKVFSDKIKLVLLSLIVAWSSAISGGYNNPSFAAGMLFVSIIIIAMKLVSSKQRESLLIKRLIVIFILCLFPIACYNFYYTRVNHIYGESSPARELTYKLDGILPGGSNIKISKEVYVQLIDLQKAIVMASKQHISYALLPQYAAFWVKSKQANPLLMDFPFLQNNETVIIHRFVQDAIKKKGKIIIIVDKNSLIGPQDTAPLSIFKVTAFIPEHFKKIEETKYFALYK